MIRTESILTRDDLHYFNQGTHHRLYEKLGAHPVNLEGVYGTYFAVWAPNAERVAVMGDFNDWSKTDALLTPVEQSGIWEGFVPGTGKGDDLQVPCGFPPGRSPCRQGGPARAGVSITAGDGFDSLGFVLRFGAMSNGCSIGGGRIRSKRPCRFTSFTLGHGNETQKTGTARCPTASWPLNWSTTVQEMGFTHVEFLPIMEHPFFGSWGYQTTGYFAPSARYGDPQDFMYLIDCLHQNGIGVILDWVPSHFPVDEHGIGFFDGTHLYEHADPRQGFHLDWKTYIFNYGRSEVSSFLISSALLWLDKYHADGLRVDAVASMLYLDYSRNKGEWIPNKFGGRENLEAIEFLRRFNETVYAHFPDVQTIAEESTAWPMVSRPSYVGGLGFGLKWDMGWMHDTLEYISKNPVHRRYHQHDLTFRAIYAFNENFVLPLSHDEIVHGKGSLMGRMPGDDWQRAANLRLLLGYMYAQPGKKLLFMGGEFGQWQEWNHDATLDWHLLGHPFSCRHSKVGEGSQPCLQPPVRAA